MTSFPKRSVSSAPRGIGDAGARERNNIPDDDDPTPTPDECDLFDEIDELNPHDWNEGGEVVVVSDRRDSVYAYSSVSFSRSYYLLGSMTRSSRFNASSSLPQSVLGSSSTAARTGGEH